MEINVEQKHINRDWWIDLSLEYSGYFFFCVSNRRCSVSREPTRTEFERKNVWLIRIRCRRHSFFVCVELTASLAAGFFLMLLLSLYCRSHGVLLFGFNPTKTSLCLLIFIDNHKITAEWSVFIRCYGCITRKCAPPTACVNRHPTVDGRWYVCSHNIFTIIDWYRLSSLSYASIPWTS